MNMNNERTAQQIHRKCIFSSENQDEDLTLSKDCTAWEAKASEGAEWSVREVTWYILSFTKYL